MTLQTLSNRLEATLKSLRTLRSLMNDTKILFIPIASCLEKKKMQIDEVYIQVKVTPLSTIWPISHT